MCVCVLARLNANFIKTWVKMREYAQIHLDFLSIVIDEDHLINLMIENRIRERVQMANETNLYAEESWPVRTRNGSGSGWCGSTFSKFPLLLSCCVPFFFTDFRSTFENFTPLVSVLSQIFQTNMSGKDLKSFPDNYVTMKRFHGDLLCVFEALFSGLLGSPYPETVRRRAHIQHI